MHSERIGVEERGMRRFLKWKPRTTKKNRTIESELDGLHSEVMMLRRKVEHLENSLRDFRDRLSAASGVAPNTILDLEFPRL